MANCSRLITLRDFKHLFAKSLALKIHMIMWFLLFFISFRPIYFWINFIIHEKIIAMSILNSVLFLKADSNYTIIHYLDGSKRIVSRTLKKMVESLNGKGFFRGHNSYLINDQYVVRICQLGSILQCGTCIPISRKLSRKEIKKRFNLQFVNKSSVHHLLRS
jgi:DNA-binding LytR/AlgR family response regulator